MKKPIEYIYKLLERVSMEVLGVEFWLDVCHDKTYEGGRIYLQICYEAPCTKSGKTQLWKGRKYYLSDHMTDDEIIKTSYVALEQAVKHEVMEGFWVDGKILFNPHVNFEALLQVADQEISRA